MAKQAKGTIRVGIGGWTYGPWRGTFYPDGLAHKGELAFASQKLTSIEINGTFYRSQSPDTFAKWHDETPDDFVFALKAPRFATTKRVLSEAGESVERFVNGGILKLGDKLGPINWQLMPTKQLDLDDFAGFLKLLPASVEGRQLRHAVEVRHDSFRSPDFVALARKHGAAIVLAGDSEHPQIADATAPFVYARIMGTSEDQKAGYAGAELDRWANRARSWAAGTVPTGFELLSPGPSDAMPRDVYLYVISGHKVRNPAAAMALIERLG